jgi:hypothetical protein
MQKISEGNIYLLLDLYLKQREELLADLGQGGPAEAADRVSRFVRSLERPYTDLPVVTDLQARLVPHILGLIATVTGLLTAVAATATLPRIEFSEPASRESRLNLLGLPLAVCYLWGITAACVVAVVLVLLSTPTIIAVITLVVIGIFATVGAATVHSRTVHHSSLPPLPLPDPQVTLSLVVSTIDGSLSAALRASDDLLAVAYQFPTGGPMLESDRVFKLLQALGAHRLVPMPEKTIEDLANDAIRLLYTAQVTLIEYSPDYDHFFDKQPAGISECRTLLPALVSDEGTLVCKGIILVPVTRRAVKQNGGGA